MQLTKYIAKNCIVPELNTSTKAEVLRELTHLLFERKKLKGSGAALDQIMAREMTESTGIGHGIAVPHARVSGLKNLICAVGRAPGGMDFMAIDRKPVELIFLICYPPAQQTTYLNFVATLAKMLREDKYKKAMMEAADEDGFFEVFEGMSETIVEREGKGKAKSDSEPVVKKSKDAHADVILLARLQLLQEMYETTRTGKREIKERMENIRALVETRVLKQYDKLMARRAPALVPVEGDTCQGCFMKLATQYVQKVRQDPEHLYACTNCSRFIYMV